MTADRSVVVRLRADIADYQRKMAMASATTAGFVKSLDTADSRMGNIVQTALALTPALVPIGGAGVTALAGLTTQLGFAAGAAGVMALGFNGIGDATKALREYELAPTEENFAKLQETMRGLGPEAREFVMFIDDITPKLQQLRETSQGEMLPDVQAGLDTLLDGRLPEIRGVIAEIADASGDLAQSTGEGLASDDWDEFFTFLEAEAEPAIRSFGQTSGNIFEAFANTWMAMDPASDQAMLGMLDWSQRLADSTENLDESERFQSFLSYLEENGPRAVETLGALGGAATALVGAAAPVGSVALPALTALARVLETVAESPAGPILIGAAAGMSAVSRAVALFNAANGSAMLGLLSGVRTQGSAAGKAAKDAGGGVAGLMASVDQARARLRLGAAALGTFALASTDLDDKLGLSNTAMGATMGLVAGPWGAAIGGGIGLVMDFAAANDRVADAVESANDAMRSGDLDAMLAEREGLQAIKSEPLGPNFLGIQRGDLDDNLAMLDARIADTRRGAGDLGDLLVGPLAGGAGRAASSVEELTDSLSGLNGLLDRSGSLLAYEQALDDLSASLRENGNVWDRSTEKGRANLEARNRLVEVAIERSQTLQEQGDALGAQRILDRAIGDLKRFAGDSKAAQQAIQPFIRELRRLGATEARPKIDADNKGAYKKLSETEKRLRKIDGEKVASTVDADNRPARRKLDQGEDWFMAWGRRNAKATVDADNKPAREAIANADSLGNMLDRQTYRPGVDVNTSGVQSAVSSVQSWLNSIPDETVYVNVQRRQLGGVQKFTASGGIFSGAQERIIAEDGDEAVVPLNRPLGQVDPAVRWLSAVAQGIASPAAAPPMRAQAPMALAGAGGRPERIVIERVVERMPRQVDLVVPGMGRLMATVADRRIDNDYRHQDRWDEHD